MTMGIQRKGSWKFDESNIHFWTNMRKPPNKSTKAIHMPVLERFENYGNEFSS